MKRSLYIVCIFVFFIVKSYSIDNYDNFQESYVEIRCGKLKDGFFPIRYDEDNKKVYIGLKSLFYFLELYDVNVDLESLNISYNVFGEDKKIKLKPHESFIDDEELYISTDLLKEKFKFRNINFDFSMLALRIVPDFILPYEEREKSEIERLRLEAKKELEKKKNFVKMHKRFFTPGFIKFFYNNYDFNKNSDISYEFGNQFLYGSLYLQGSFKKRDLVEYGNLTYNNIVANNDLILGNIYLDVPHFVNVDSNIVGFTFNNIRNYFFKDGNFTIIKGEAEGAETIELYSGSFLLDYIHPNGKNFEFKISDGNMTDCYILKIYYSNGVIEERKVFSINDLNILEKGKNKVNIQLGKGTKNGYLQGNFNILHGITNNITLGIGNRILTSENGKKYRFIENDILLNTRHKIFPTVIEFKNFYELKYKENNYNLDITQKYKEWQLNFTYETYSKYIFYENEVKNYKSISLGKNFKNNYLEGGLNTKRFYDFGVNKNIYIYWSTYTLSPVYFSLKVEKSLESACNQYSIYPTISYYGYFSTILEGKFIKKDNNRWNNSYNLKIRKRNVELIKDKLYGDIGLFFKYYTEKHAYTYGLDFNIKLDDFIYTKINSNVVKGKNGKSEVRNGVEINKILALKKPLLKLDNNSSVTSSVIYGTIFLDKNSNGIYDEGDLPIENGVVIIDGIKFKSDKQGRYTASGIGSPRTIELEIDRKSIDPMTKSIFKKLKIKTESSGQLKVDIPIDIISIVSGNIYNELKIDDNKFSRKLALVNIQLIKDNIIVSEIKPEFDGLYFFEDVFPGKYKIKFIYLGEENYRFSNNEININVDTSGKESGEYFEGYDTDLLINEVN